MTGLVLPRHVAVGAMNDLRRQKEAAAAAALSKGSGGKPQAYRYDSDDFVSPKDIEDQLTTLQAFIDGKREATGRDYHLPKPSGWKLSVLVLTIPETSAGGVIIVDDTREARAVSSPQGIVLALGPGAYRDPHKFEVDGEITPWHQPGDRISFVKYDAQLFHLANGQMLGFMNDTQPVSLLDRGWKVPA